MTRLTRVTRVMALVALTVAPASPPALRLKVSPRLGVAPLAVRVTASTEAPGHDDELELVALEGELVIRRTARDLDGGARAWIEASWTLPAGEYVVGACLWPSGRCSSVPVLVK